MEQLERPEHPLFPLGLSQRIEECGQTATANGFMGHLIRNVVKFRRMPEKHVEIAASLEGHFAHFCDTVKLDLVDQSIYNAARDICTSVKK